MVILTDWVFKIVFAQILKAYLIQSLRKSNHYWYEMKSESMAEFVLNINYDNSLFVAQLERPSFIDQRLIGLSIKDRFRDLDRTLILALLNSNISMFFIESLGFGRGLGTLDLNKTKFGNNFNILNPNMLGEEQKMEIITAFRPLMERNRLPLLEELEATDRLVFEVELMRIYGMTEYSEAIKNSLRELYTIRFAVKDS